MGAGRSYKVQLSREAAKRLRWLGDDERARIEAALRRLASGATTGTGDRGGKSLKRLRGRHDSVERLRVGRWRVLLDLDHEAGVLLVHAIVDRRDLERWLRSR